jgi:predicted DNA binding protein
MNDKLRRAPIGILEVTTDGEIRAANQAAATLLEADDDLVGHPVTEALPRSATGTLRDAFADGSPVERSIEEYYPEIDRWLDVDLVDAEDGVVLYVRDRTRRQEREQTIDRLEQRLGRLEAIDSLVATVLRRVIDASARDEVWRTVCERLGTTDLYEFAWVGERDLADDRLRIIASAGDAPEMRETIGAELEADGEIPEQRVVADESTRVVQTIADEGQMPRDFRVAAFGHGLHSCIAIPLAYGETVYGVMGVYAARKDGFSDQEIASLETLGAVAGFAVNAIKHEDLLFADTFTELTIAVRDDELPFVEASTAVEGTLMLDGAVVRDDDVVVCYLRADGVTDEVVATLEDHDCVSTVRAIQEAEERSLLEVSVSGATPITTLTDWGATIVDATYTADAAIVVAELSADSEVRGAVEVIDERFAETDVRAKEEQAREPETMEAFQNELAEMLTDKQRKVLQTAHLSDYFTSPRGSTSEEVAEALDISGPTVLYHLRNAQRALLDAFFDENTAVETDR